MSEPTSAKKLRVVDREERELAAHPDTMVALGKKLLNNKEDCDVFFLVGPEKEKIGAHKLILKARSSVFEVMFSPRWKEGLARDGDEIVLEDEEPSVFRSFLEYVYANLFSAHAAQAVKLLHLAQFYNVQPLAKLCREAFATKVLTMDEMVQVFLTGKKYQLSLALDIALFRISRSFILLKNTPALEKFDEADLILFLEREDLCVAESQLFDILLKWADKQIENSAEDPRPDRKEVLKNLIPFVRFPTMTPNEFASVVAPTNILPEHIVIRLFMYLNSDEEEMRVGIGESLPFSKTRRRGMPIRIDLYKKSCRPGQGFYPETLLKKFSDARDILSFNFKLEASDGGRMTERELKPRIVSLVLQGPRCGNILFENGSLVEEIYPIKVGISLCLAPSYTNVGHHMFPVAEEVTASVGQEEMELTLDKPWELSNTNMYKIALRFMSDVYGVPKALDHGSGEGRKRRDEGFDFFTSAALQDKAVHRTSLGTIEFSKVSMDTGVADPFVGVSLGQAYNLLRVPTAVSTGLHLLRALYIQY